MNESDDFEWLDTKLVNRQMVPLIFIIAVDFVVTIGLFLANLLPVVVLIAAFLIILVVSTLGYYSGGKETRRRAPILLGLSSSRIRLQFFDGHVTLRNHSQQLIWSPMSHVHFEDFR